MTHERGEALVRKWAPKFGLGEFRIQVVPLDPDQKKAWALSFYDVDEMWAVISLPVDDLHSPALLELLVLHELSHGMLMLCDAGASSEEQTCNRIARLTSGDYDTKFANHDEAERLGENYWKKKVKPRKASGKALTTNFLDKRAWLPIVTDALPADERVIINLLYWEGRSLREVAAELGVAHTTVEDRRNKALRRLAEYFAKLENTEWHTARRIIALPMPEGGAEHEVVYLLHHRCSVANALIRTEVGSEDMDLLIFPVGNYGYGMPLGIPFGVQALDPCGACGQDVGVYFVWQAGHSSHPGEIWTPE